MRGFKWSFEIFVLVFRNISFLYDVTFFINIMKFFVSDQKRKQFKQVIGLSKENQNHHLKWGSLCWISMIEAVTSTVTGRQPLLPHVDIWNAKMSQTSNSSTIMNQCMLNNTALNLKKKKRGYKAHHFASMTSEHFMYLSIAVSLSLGPLKPIYQSY